MVDDPASGTPPRGRGRPTRKQLGGAPWRIRNTPARAGTTSTASRWSPMTGEHPRAGGDDWMPGHSTTKQPGTPPRGRGRHPEDPEQSDEVGNTPARAGTTTSPGSRPCPWREHPRAGGDDWCRAWPYSFSPGTPPRGRGRLTPQTTLCLLLRNTPARAGTTHCGVRQSSPQTGTPPRGRGRLGPGGDVRPPDRNTPARAGTTTSTVRRCGGPVEHPRAGGDDQLHGGGPLAGAGTPPRGRGRPALDEADAVDRRNTPARAGTTC